MDTYSLLIPHRPLLAVLSIVASLSILDPISARPVPQNLGNGLDKLVESNLALKGKTGPARAALARFSGYTTQQAASYATAAIKDAATNRFMVDIPLSGKVSLVDARQTLTTKFPSLQITATDANYRGTGVIEGYVSIDDVPALAQSSEARSVHLVLKPLHRARKIESSSISALNTPITLLGTTFDQGVTQHRVDKINQLYTPAAPVNYTGAGISIGFLSDSFNTSGGNPNAAQDVTNKDLPGAGNSTNTQPVFILQEGPAGATDEGRGMVQIGYKMAPKARLGFATADSGEVGFANNIRGLAALPTFQQTFKADVICDDVGYLDEPFFQNGVIGDGIDDVYAAGVSYFSSAANDIGINGYDSDLRIVPNGSGLTAATNTALANTNINLAGVPAGLYAGGFHNFNPSGLDVAQTVNIPSAAVLAQYLLTDFFVIMQWDDAYDSKPPVLNQPAIYHTTGTIDGTTTTSITYDNTSTPPLPPFNAGTEYVITETATSGDFDGIISVIDPNGNTVLTQDTGTDEVVVFFPSISGQHKIKVDHFASTSGSFTLDVNTANGTPLVSTDLNLLMFDTNTGAYLSTKSLTSNNVASNRPIELAAIMGDATSSVQFVIARGNTPTAPNPATHVRYVMPGNGLPDLGPAEYFTYNAPTTGGHAIVNGCNGTAAYSAFRPSIPESFTSPGPATIYFDTNNNRLNPPLVRQQPSVAACDGGNTSFFVSDSNGDSDTAPNFFGTSAAAPHAAACAALVLEAHGGRGKVSPAAMRTILHNTAFAHDLDPVFAKGTAQTANGGTVAVTIYSDNEAQAGTGANDPNSITVAYSGPGHIATLSFNSNGLASEGGNVTGGNNGVDATNTYFSDVFPGVVFLPTDKAFTVGTSLPNSLAPTDVVATPSNPAPAPSNSVSQFWTLGMTFPTSNFTSGKALHFTIGRGEQHSSDVENSLGMPVSGTTIANYTADIWGGGVLIPEGTTTTDGMRFSGTMDDGSPFVGRVVNRIGTGYSPLDGFGFINAQAAVGLPQLISVASKKTHGVGGPVHSIDLPLTGTPGIECRAGGPVAGDHQVVFTFAVPVTVGSATVTHPGGTASVSGSPGISGNDVIVNLTNVGNAQTITINLIGVNDTFHTGNVSVPMSILFGDVNGASGVTGSDVNLTKVQVGAALSTTNFRSDVNASGAITGSDVNLIKAQIGTTLP